MHPLSSPALVIVFRVKAVTDILEAREQCAKYAPFTRRVDANSKYDRMYALYIFVISRLPRSISTGSDECPDTTSQEMSSALDYFTCLPKYRVVLCKICHYCVWPDNARSHLREKYSRLPKAERALICDELQALQGVSHSHEQFRSASTGFTLVPEREVMSTRARGMHLCLPFDGQPKEALANSTQVNRDWEKGRI